MRLVAALLTLSLMLAGCSASDRSQPAVTEPDVQASPTSELEGSWTAGPVSVLDLRRSMRSAGIKPADVDAWVTQVGSPSSFTFMLTFTGSSFTLAEQSPRTAMQVDESGTFSTRGERLVLAIDQTGAGDSDTFNLSLRQDSLRLRLLGTTERGTKKDQAEHRIYTIAYYASVPFRRVPSL